MVGGINDYIGIRSLIKKIGEYVIYDHFSRNTHPKAVELMIDSFNNYNRNIRPSAANPAAIEWILDHPKAYNSGAYWSGCTEAYENPGMIGTLTEFTCRGAWLSGNSHPSVIRALQKSPHVIDWEAFSANPGIFEYRRDQKVVAALMAASE